jgi:hypothetical protein
MVVIEQIFQVSPKDSKCTKMGQLKQPRIGSSVPKGQKVATLNLQVCSFIRNQKIVPKKKVQKKVPNNPLSSLPKKKGEEKPKQPPFESAQKKKVN